jgi:hypothetical protein
MIPWMKSDRKPVPNGYDCGGCPDWDDINGCWAGETNVLLCPYLNQEEDFDEEDEYDVY